MTGTYQPRGRVYARYDIDDEALAPGILTEGSIGRPGILSYFGPFDGTIEQEAASPDRVFALDVDADPLFMKQRRTRFSGVDLDTDPDAGDTMAPGVLSEAPMARSATPADLQPPNDDTEQQPVVLGTLVVTDRDAEEPAITDQSGIRFSNPRIDADPIPGTVSRTAEPLGPGVLTAPIQSGNTSYRRPAGSPDGLNAGPLNDLPAPRKSTYGRAGIAESFIPFWGAGRDLYADIEERDYLGAAINGGLLVADAFTFAIPPANMAMKAAVAGARAGGVIGGLKGALKGSAYAIRGPILRKHPSHAEWTHVRKTMGKHGWFEPRQHGHHWLFPQRWKWVPNWIRNHPLNIKKMPTPIHNYRIEGAYAGFPEYTIAEKLWHGMPGWAKVLSGEVAVGRPAKAGYYLGSGHYGSKKNDQPAPAVSGPGADPGTGTQ